MVSRLCGGGEREGGGEGREREREREGVYLDLNQLLDAIDDPDMFGAVGPLADDGLVAGAQPAVLEDVAVGLVVVQVAEHDAGGADEQFAGLVVAGDVVAFDGHEARFDGGEERARRSEPDVVWGGGADDCACFGEAWGWFCFLLVGLE